ncbi:arginyl-tRNA synthetase [Pyrrhoderma noxium]|uniref:Arginyl-tRNA synthetase n=1 Tax=Pyrrhoderma noxium TaxID=2282107 RepID=A0A286USA7_9AGAM|nr:arginyl-tRNA synthetase [Pyrrhoderma noxium]
MSVSSSQPTLPSVLPSCPAMQDTNTTAEQINSGLGRVTTPTETPIYICAYAKCNRLFPSRDRLVNHRKRDHNSDEMEHIISWNE